MPLHWGTIWALVSLFLSHAHCYLEQKVLSNPSRVRAIKRWPPFSRSLPKKNGWILVMNIQNSWQRGMRMERHISSLREVGRGCDEGEEEECVFVGGGGGKLVRACKWLWLVVVQSGEEKRGRQRLVVCCLVKEGQLREHSGGRSCDGVTRNKSDIKLESGRPAPFAEANCSHY